MIQTPIRFECHPNDDPYAYIINILEICYTLKINEVNDNAI